MGEAKRYSDTYTPAEVAEYCRVTRRTVYDWLSTGRLSAFKAGPKVWVITRVQLDLFLAGRPGIQEEKHVPLQKDLLVQHASPLETLPQRPGKLSPMPQQKKTGRRW